jgi:alpha-L-rhamnosidase
MKESGAGKLLFAAGCAALLTLAATCSMAQDIRQGFLNPPPEARPMMRWWWFGPAVVKPELGKELRTMAANGVGGVEIQPVYPLMLDNPAKGIRNLRYLSPEFLDDVSFANRTARALGLRVSITLGSGWPYGGPHTTLALAAGRLKVIALPASEAASGLPHLAKGDSLVAAFLVSGAISGKGESFDAGTARQIEPGKPLPASAAGDSVLYFVASHTGQQVKRAAYGAEGYVLDHFSHAAIDEHLKDVATPLVNAFGNEAPQSVFSDSLEVYESDWTPNLPAEFKKRRGYDLIPHLPEIVVGGTTEAEAVRHDWGETLSELVRENYLAPLAEFAKAHHTLFRSQTYGEPAVTLADEAVPQLPEGEGPQWRSFSFARWATSAGHLYGRNVISAETWTWLHSPAFRATPLDMKAEADRMFLIGINQFVGHGWPYSPPAAGEPGWNLYAAAVFNSHNPWFPVMPDVMRYMTRVSWLLRQGKPANDVALLLPEDDAQAAFSPGHVSVTNEMRKRITPALMSAILDAGYNVDYIDAATINKLNDIPYAVLVIPDTERIPLAAYRRIERYATAGGKVIAVGTQPSLAPGLLEKGDSPAVAAVSTRLFHNAGHMGVAVESVSDLAGALHHALPPDIETTGQIDGIGFIHRKLPNSDIYFVANTSKSPIDGTISFRPNRCAGKTAAMQPTRRWVEAWNPDSGKVIDARGSDCKQSGIPLALAPYESRIFVLGNHTQQETESHAAAHGKQMESLDSDWSIRFGNEHAASKLDSLTSWTEIPNRQYYSGEADYTRSFHVSDASDTKTRLMLDFGEGRPIENDRPPDAPGMHALLVPPIREAAVVYVNGKRAGSLWHPPYRIDITSLVHRGENRTEVRVFNTAINLLAGQPPRDYSALYAKYGKRFEPQDMENLHPIPSGMMGPVRLIEETAN